MDLNHRPPVHRTGTLTWLSYKPFAEAVGFGPTRELPLPAFKAGALVRYATPPWRSEWDSDPRGTQCPTCFRGRRHSPLGDRSMICCAEDVGFEPTGLNGPLAFRASPVQPLRANPPYAVRVGFGPTNAQGAARLADESRTATPGHLTLSNGRGQADPLVRADQHGRDSPASLRTPPRT